MLWLPISMACAYLFLQVQYIYYWKQVPAIVPEKGYQPDTRISVVIPARNEADHIEQCLASVTRQVYPERLREIIVIDDHSSDSTARIVQDKFPGVRLLALQTAKKKGGKKNALRYGIEQATGQWIITVDADCILKGDALAASVYAHEKLGHKLVTGPVFIDSAEDNLGKFQSYELAGLMLITGSGYQSGLHALANGAFLSFDKAAYQSVDRELHGVQYASGDDLFLAEVISEQYPGRTGFLKNKSVYAETTAESDLKGFVLQRVRWASKNKGLRNRNINYIWGFAWLYCVFILISFVSGLVWQGQWLSALMILLAGKLAGDLAILHSAFTYFKKPFSFTRFIVAGLYHLVYVFVAGLWVVFGIDTYEWKGRTVQ